MHPNNVIFTMRWLQMVLLALLMFVGGVVQAATCTSKSSGNWNGGTNVWSGCTLTSNAPPVGANVAIVNTITVNSSPGTVVANITVSSGGTLRISSGVTLSFSGNFTNSGTFTASSTYSGTMAFTGTAQTITGNTTFYKMSVASTLLTLAGNVVVTSTMTGTPDLKSTCPTRYTFTYGSSTLDSCLVLCSSYKDVAFINEVRIGKSGSTAQTSNQIEIYNSSNVSSTIWKTWKLVVNYKSGTNTPTVYTYPLSTGFTNNGKFLYNNTTKIVLRNRSGRYIDIALTDSAGNFIDYVAIGGTSAKMQTTPSCMSPTTAVTGSTSGSDSSGNLSRLPDGSNWPSAITNAAAHTIGQTNSCSVGVNDLVVSNAADIANPIANITVLTYTVTVLNKSCTATINNVSVTDTGISTANFSSLNYTAGPTTNSPVTTTSVTAPGASAPVWTIGTLKPGTSATLTIIGTPTVLGALAAIATVSAPGTTLSNTTDDSATANITVRDFNYVGFDLLSDVISEGLDTTYTVYISSNILATKPITVSYTVSGTAGSGDTNLASGSVTIDPANVDQPQSAQFSFTITNDSVYEPTKSIILTIPSNGVSSVDAAVKLDTTLTVMTITLVDDDMPPEVALYHLDEISWNGTPGEVNDSSVNGFDGKAKGSIGLPKAQSTTPAMTGDPGTCGYGTFGGANTVQYVALGAPNLGIDGASGLSVSAWVRWGIDPTTGNNWANIVSNGNSGSGQFWLQHSQLNDRFEFAVKTSSTRNYVQSRTKPVSGQWYHVAGVYDGAGLHIYLNGVLDDNSTAVLTGTVSPFISTYLFNIGIDNSFARSFQGDIDEVRVFNGVLSASQVANIAAEAHTCPVVLAPDHIEISDSSGGSGVTCAPTTLTLRACADSSCATLYSGGINGTLTASTTGTPNWGAGTADFTIPASGSVTKTLQLTSVNSNVSATLGVTSAATNAATCTFVGNPGNCVFTAYNSGFIFSVPNHVAGTPQTVTIRAVKKADNSNACVAGLGNVTRTLQMSCAYTNPSTGTLPMQVGGRYLNSSNSASAACSSASGVSLAFDGSGVTTTTMSYSDVGKMLLTVAYPGSVATGDDGLSINGTSAFIAAPKDFAFSDMTSGPIKAGNNFTVTVTARNSQSAPTPNFGKESAPESVTVTHAKYQPIGGAASAGVFSGALSAFNNGAATASNLNWSEVGTIDISATLASANYQGSGLTATGNTGATGAVGPFIPDHFITTVTDGCTGCGFTYSGQPFAVTVTAKNGLATPTTTVNYDGTDNTSPKFAKQVTLSAWDAATGSAPPGSLLPVANTVVPLSAFEQGVAARNTTASQPFFTFTATPTAPTSIKIRAVETSAIPAVSSSGFTEGSTEIRSGRMKLSNQYGSELLALPVNLVAQYWINASAAWVNSATDNATSFVVASPATASALSFSNFQRNLTTVSVSGSPLTINLANGTGRFTLAAPGAGHIGSVDMLIPALSGLSCETAPVLLGCYLPSSTARATFGIYKSPLIYRRENY